MWLRPAFHGPRFHAVGSIGLRTGLLNDRNMKMSTSPSRYLVFGGTGWIVGGLGGLGLGTGIGIGDTASCDTEHWGIGDTASWAGHEHNVTF